MFKDFSQGSLWPLVYQFIFLVLTALVVTMGLQKGIEKVSKVLMPVLFNGVFVGAEIAWFAGENTFWQAFVPATLSVAAGEAAVVLVLGTLLFYLIKRNQKLQSLLD